MFKGGNPLVRVGAVVTSALLVILTLVGAGPAKNPAKDRPIRPVGVPGRYMLTQSFTPEQLYSWRFPTNQPGGWTCTVSQVQLRRLPWMRPQQSVIDLHTTGADGNCAVIQSTKLFPTTAGVIQARIYLSAIPGQPTQVADWAAMWMYGPNWPTDGEIDAVESSYGSSAVTYHYGSSDPSSPSYNLSYTTYRPLYPVNAAGTYAQPLYVTGPNVRPGWNTVDIAFSDHTIRIYYNGTLYTTAEGSYVTGQPAYLDFDDVSQAGENTLGIPGDMLVSSVQVFSPAGPPGHSSR